ncbi:hypothetical protein [Syntrophotalea acetylenivorans]|nr:hypothetical protein [Syntrophotalea acetylenivorans]
MKQRKLGMLISLIAGVTLLVTSAMAMDGHEQHKMSESMDHGQMQDMNGMDDGMAHGQGMMVILGEDVQEGVKAMCHLMPIDLKMMPAGSKATHHLMVRLSDAETGKPVESGTVAIKIGSPDGKEAAPVRLMGMQGHFGADVVLDQLGIWHFRIAAKLAEGKVHKYHGHHVIK